MMTYAWIAFAGSVVCVAVAILWSRGKQVKCPACGLAAESESPSSAARICPVCGVYAVRSGRAYVRVTDTYVHGHATFGTALPRAIRWPEGCCVCEQPATRNVPVTLVIEEDAALHRELAVRVASLGFLKAIDRRTFVVDVPHCAQHSDGAGLGFVAAAVRPTSEAPRIGERMLADRDTQADIGILFRSYPYFRNFLAANGGAPQPMI